MTRHPFVLALLIAAACNDSGGIKTDVDLDGVGVPEDCDDTRADVYPGAPEICDNLDNDCDGLTDEADTGDVPSWYADTDHDGYGDPKTEVDGCFSPDGFIEDGTDCNDSDASVFPGALEIWYDGIDQDCMGYSDYDADQDGQDAVGYNGIDCDDTNPDVYAGADETWYDGIDQDCAGDSDYDADLDGFDSADHLGDDCDDSDAAIHPGAEEIWYDGVDQDCAGGDDYDADGDGFGLDDDCDDADASIHPDAKDAWYDGIDQDCAGNDDFDADLDGFASSAWGGTDCDDTLASTHPGAADTFYDGVDSDCAGDSDYDMDLDGSDSNVYGGDDCNDKDPLFNQIDADGDAWSTCDGDCDDADATVSPGAQELKDGIDQNCNGLVDDMVTTVIVTTTDDFMGGGQDGNGILQNQIYNGEWMLAPQATEMGSGIATTAMSSTRSSTGLVAVGGFLYVIGGSSDDYGNGYVDQVLSAPISDGVVGAWTAISSLPNSVTTAGVASDGNCLVFAGGTDGDYQSAVYTAVINGDGSIGSWQAQTSLPANITGLSGTYSMGYVFVAGGEDDSGYWGNTIADVYAGRLDPDCTIDAWTQTADLPAAHYYGAMVAAGGHLYYTGGENDYSSATNDVWMATPDSTGAISSWVTLDDLPGGRYGHGLAVVDGLLVVTGGNDGQNSQDDIWYAAIAADGSLGSWTTSATVLPDATYYHRIAAFDGYIYQAGGRVGSGYNTWRTDEVWSFAPVIGSDFAHTSTWSYTFDLGTDSDVAYLDWGSFVSADGWVEASYRLADGASATPGAWVSGGNSGRADIVQTARYIQVWLVSSSATGTNTGVEDVTIGYR